MENEVKTSIRKSLKERFPLYVWICFAWLLAIDMLVFYGTRIALPYLTLHDLSTPLDKMIPLRPAWITIYFFSFVTWVVGILVILADGKPRAYRLCGAYAILSVFAAICFLGYPGTLERPEITGTGIFNDWMRFLYKVDEPVNLCPSYHVVINYFCWRCTFGSKRIPKWYQWFTFVYLILVCFCVLFVKQHVIVDIFAAFLLSELSVQIARLTRVERIPYAIERAVQRSEAQKP